MENRYLPPARQKPLRRGEGPILHENILLSVLCVSNEPLASWGEWVVNLVRDTNHFGFQSILSSLKLRTTARG